MKLNSPFSNLVRTNSQKLILPLYHTLSNGQPIPHIDSLYQARSVQKFKEDIDFFLKYYKPVNLSDIIKQANSGQDFSEPSFHITFDDGLRSFQDLAVPALKEKGIQATCFLNNSFIGNKDLFYRYKIALLCDYIKAVPASRKLLEQFSESDKLKKNLTYLKNLKFKDLNIIEEIASKLDYSFAEFLLQEKPYLSSNEINKLIEEGFTFGAHSFEHPDYIDMNEEDQISATLKSVEDIRSRFMLKYSAFAFPFTDYGVKSSFFEKVKSKLDVSFGTAGLKKSEYNFHFHRIAMEKTALRAQKIITAEYLYYFLKMPFGKNEVQRK